ncbi:MAG TPA: RAMP superfamily CRISPR-associated protein [Candidatus Bathyarchaeia archaeon]|nr:RAMP superfamily CRISPR-associated protein [Candidatus Bathyarchaeia archaeon]
MVTQNFNRLTVKMQAWFTKTLNGSSGTSSFLMRGGEIPYQYQGKAIIKASELDEFIEQNKETILDDLQELQEKAKGRKADAKLQVTLLKEELGITRVVKGIRGAIRHKIMSILHERNIDYCSPTLKKEFQGSKEPTLLENEHLMGSCDTNPCPIRQLFGIMGEESKIRIWSDVIVQTDKSLEKISEQKGLSFVYVSTEMRHASRRDKKTLQDFSEQYFSGVFKFYVEFAKEIPDWLLGLLTKGILGITHLGNGSNSGYGRVEIKEITYEQVAFERKLGPESNGRIAIIEEEQTVNLNNQLEECLAAWNNYH